jgi:hypothetical protein
MGSRSIRGIESGHVAHQIIKEMVESLPPLDRIGVLVVPMFYRW